MLESPKPSSLLDRDPSPPLPPPFGAHDGGKR